MQIINQLTDDHFRYWSDQAAFVRPLIMRCPDDMPHCSDCQTIATADTPDGQHTIRVAWRPNVEDIANLAQGGTIWLSCVGGLPPHFLEVQAP